MSKSLGNFFVLHELFEHFDPMVVRYYYTTHHYRTPIEFSFELLAQAQKNYQKLVRIFEHSSIEQSSINFQYDIVDKMLHFLQDDLNTPGFLGIFFENIHEITQNEVLLLSVKFIFVTILGLTLEPIKDKKVVITKEIQAIIDERHQARREKNWSRADQLRDVLITMGVDVQDDKI
jgi:cysteinyl-tRNA synthetase